MIERIAALIVDESRWLPFSMIVALLATSALLYRGGEALPPRRRVLAAMNLFFGITIGVMAVGHVLAVTTKLARGTLEGSIPLLYAIGVLVAAPSWSLFRHGRKLLLPEGAAARTTVLLNLWLSLTLLALGLHNLPIAVPALFNIVYSLHSRRGVGWAMVVLALLVNGARFVGAVMFFLSGQSFEQFTGIE